MKKKILSGGFFIFCSLFMEGQTAKSIYPIPEYSNEIYLLTKGENITVVRLEKGSSKMENKMKMGGMGGGNNGYTIEGEKSTVRIGNGNKLTFLYYTGTENSGTNNRNDSGMQSGAMDMSAMSSQMAAIYDPSQNNALYSMTTEKGKRSIVLQSYQGMRLLGKPKKESIKYTLSIKKIKEGYTEMLVDKPLPKGEYGFLIMSLGSMDGQYLLFTFGVD